MAPRRFPASATFFGLVLGVSFQGVAGGLPQALLAQESLLTQEADRVQFALKHLRTSRSELRLDQSTEFAVKSAFSDTLGQTHVRFQQLHQGVPVWGGVGISHLGADGRVLPLTDGFHRGIQVSTTPSMDPSEIRELALRDLFATNDQSPSAHVELVVFPELERTILPGIKAEIINADQQTTQVIKYTLAYHLRVEWVEASTGRPFLWEAIVNAHTGALLSKWNALQTGAAEGTGKSQHSGIVKIATSTITTGYELRDLGRGGTRSDATTGNLILNMDHATSGMGMVVTDSDNTWGDGLNYIYGSDTSSPNGQTSAVDAAFGLQSSWDYFLTVHGRSGIDGAGRPTAARVHYGSGYDNAFWSNSCFCITYGDGSSLKALNSLDVAGHELTHGVTQYTAGLLYFGESGGLNEATSDIFGTMIEFHARGGAGPIIGNTGGNWTQGEQLSTLPLRYLYKPSLDGQSPDAWSPSIEDLDVHLSSGPMNRCFYFLSQGASADTSSHSYSPLLPGGMSGLGNDKAAPIWYRALTTYLTPTSGYKEARQAALRAATDLYGGTSPELAAVQNAFAAINVGGPAGTTEDLQSPTVSASVTGTQGVITLEASAADNIGVSRVAFWVDGVPVGQVTSAPFRLTIDSTTMSNGVHGLIAKAYDAAGNVGISSNVAFTLENNVSQVLKNPGFEAGEAGWTVSPNVIALGYPLWAHGGQGLAWLGGWDQPTTDFLSQQVTLPPALAGAQLRFWLNVIGQDYGGVPDTLKIRVLDTTGTELGALGTFTTKDIGNQYLLHTYDMSPYAGKTVRIQFDAVSAGVSATSFLLDDLSLRVALKDLDAPTVSATVAGGRGTITLQAQAQDDVAVTKVELWVDGVLKSTVTGEPYRSQLDSTTLSNGPHSLVAKAFDASGKIGTSSTVTFTVDNQAPSVTVAVSGSKGNLTLSATASDNQDIARVEFFVDGAYVGTSTTLPYQVDFDSTVLKNGTHSLTARAYDSAGNLGQSSLPFAVDNPDTKAPTITASEYGMRGNISLQAYANDNVGVTKIEAYLDDKVVATRSSSHLFDNFDSTRLSDGAHTYVAKAYDAAGNVGISNSVALTIDNTPPTISITAPASTSGSFKLTATAADNLGLNRVEFRVDGNWISGGSVSTPPYELNLDSTQLRNGSHTVQATAIDNAGNATSTSELTFSTSNPDTTPPTFSSISAPGGQGVIQFATWVQDINGVSKVEFYVDGALKGTYNPTYGYAYLSFDSKALPDGSHLLVLKAYDPSGNVGSSAPLNFTVDNTPPTVSATATLDGTTLTMSANATDASGIHYVTFYLDDGYQGNAYTSPYALKMDAAYLPNGTHSLTATATDLAGNFVRSAPFTFVLNTPDITPPTANAYVWGEKGTLELSAYASDINGVTKVEFFVDGALVGSEVPNYGTARVTLDSTKLTDGIHQFFVKAFDAAGNQFTTPTRDFTVDNTPPSQVTAFESGVSGNLVLSATATDNLGIRYVEFYIDDRYAGWASSAPFTTNYNSQYLKNGPHTLVAKAYDAANNLATSPAVSFSTNNPDTAAPYVYVSTWGSGTLNCTAYADDMNGVVKVEFFVDGQFKGTGTKVPGDATQFQFSFSTAGLSNGTHDLVAKAWDASGNVGSSYPSTFYVDASDTTPPAISQVAVSGTRDTITLSASVTDDREVAKVEFWVDRVLMGTKIGAPYSFSIDSTPLPNGDHSLVVRAFDLAGNQTSSPDFPFRLTNPDRTIPSVTVSAEGSAGSILLTAEASDEGGIARVDFYVDDVLKGSDYEGPYQQTLASEGLTNGTHLLVAKAYDLVGNAGTSAPLSFLVDNTDTIPPVTAAWVNGSSGSIRLNANASDNRGVVKVVFYVDGLFKGESSAAPHALTLDSSTLSNGSHTLVAKASDAAGNTGSSPAVPFTISNIQITASPANGVIQKGRQLTFTAAVTGTSNTDVLWAVVEAQGGTVTAGGVYTAPATLGIYHLTVTSVADPNVKSTLTVHVVNPPDLNGDGVVNGVDVGNLARAFSGSGKPAETPDADLDGDGDVDDDDLASLLAEFEK